MLFHVLVQEIKLVKPEVSVTSLLFVREYCSWQYAAFGMWIL